MALLGLRFARGTGETVLERQVMWTLRILGAAGVLAAGIACSATESGQDDELSPYELGYTGDYVITSVSQACAMGDEDIQQWIYAVSTDGWAEGLELHITETAGLGRREGEEDPPAEVHQMSNVAYDAAGTWDEWSLSLVVVDDALDQVSGATTQWGCYAEPVSGSGGALAWMARMSPANAPSETVCAIWGFKAEDWYNDSQANGCACIDADKDCTN